MKRLLALALIGLFAGCAQSECTIDPRHPNQPVSALECASDRVCYRGGCVQGCRAGSERVEDCRSDDDCSGARPHCTDGYCSACDPGTACVPGANICQSIYEIPLPPERDASTLDLSIPPRPRDGGPLDAGLVPMKDAGVITPIDPTPVSHTLLIDLARIDDAASSTRTVQLNVRGFDVRGNEAGLDWLIEGDRPVVRELVETGGPCEVNRLLDPPVLPTPAGLDEVRIENYLLDPAPEAMETPALEPVSSYTATFDPLETHYVLTATPTTLNLSNYTTLKSTFVSVSGPGSDLTAGSWPLGSDFRMHVPFPLSATGDAVAIVASPVVIGQDPTRDLNMEWSRVDKGVVSSEFVFVRLVGKAAELRCREAEGPNTPGRIRVTAGLLEAFIDVERPEPGARLPLYFERANELQLQVDPPEPPPEDMGVPRPTLRHLVIARIRHTLETSLVF